MEEQVAKQNHRKKRRRIAEESFEAQEGYKARLKGILVSMTDYISKEESKVSKTAAAQVQRRMHDVQELFADMMVEIGSLGARLEERERMEERIYEEIERERSSWVSRPQEVISTHSTPKTQKGTQRGVRMVGGGKKEDVPAVPLSPTYALVVKGGEVKEGSKVKEKLIEIGKGMNVKVKAIRQTKEGVIMEMASEEERKKVLADEGWKDKGLHFEQPKVFPPLVSIVGVPKDMDNQELVEELWLKNLSTRMKQDEDFGMKVKRRNSGRGLGQFDTVILEVTPNVRDVLLGLGRVYVGLGSCRVYLYERVLRCLGCYGYAHIKADCKRPARCIRCGREGHKGRDCKGKVECGNCRDRGLNCQHSALSEACPEHKWRLQRWRERVMK
ncbi:unnamed protein product [Trichogramma brassicae]|uniref:CCHC-type domain-containing protein n=1 Tax=Trichogramma brassicae TaxID=86971 RepID=A0A6H5IYB5_9HYME|nr:unnamed protein product [Trichogramma brassicae]